MKIGKGTKIHHPVFIGPDVEIGENCRVQMFAYIPDNVFIGNNVFIGPSAVFTNDKYPPSGARWKVEKPTRVMDGAVIGGGAVILPNVVIHKGAKIAAGAVVTKDVGENMKVAGVPAREIETIW